MIIFCNNFKKMNFFLEKIKKYRNDEITQFEKLLEKSFFISKKLICNENFMKIDNFSIKIFK